MGRVKIKFPDKNSLSVLLIPVRISDVNYGGHVGNDSILSIIHEARMLMLANSGYTEMDAGGNSMIMADVMIAYKGEAFYGDILTVSVYAEEITERTFDLLYHISTRRGEQIFEIAHAKTGMVCFDYKTRKIAQMTEEFRSFLLSADSRT